MSDIINHWRTLSFYDPARVLIELRKLERTIPPRAANSKVVRLRTNQLKKIRESRDAALFSYGMGLAQGTDIAYAPEEAADYDFVTTWFDGDFRHYCPVQLKELVPADLGSRASLRALLSDLAVHSLPTDTVLAIRLNRAGRFDPASVQLPPLGYRQVWYFGAITPRAERWVLFGDAKAQVRRLEFDYPEPGASA